MNFLAFDTSAENCTVALQIGQQTFEREILLPKQQANLILPLIQELLDESGAKLQDLNAIVYGAGPGSFTGVRIALSVAQTLAYALNIRLVPVSSLALLAQTAVIKHAAKKVLVARDARMGKVYWGAYQYSNETGTVSLRGEEQTVEPHEVVLDNHFLDKEVICVGDGFEEYKTILLGKLTKIPKSIDPTLTVCAKAMCVPFWV